MYLQVFFLTRGYFGENSFFLQFSEFIRLEHISGVLNYSKKQLA